MKLIISFLIICSLIATGIYFWWQNASQAVNPKDTAGKIFVVTKGSGVQQIATDLHEQGLICNEFVFRLIVKQLNLDQKIQSGTFRLSPSMKAETIAKQLSAGSLDIWVTIPEGKRADEIADILQESMPNYDESWRIALNQYEGYLFPDTYLFPREAGITQIISRLRDTFDAKYAEITNSTSRNQEEIVIIASMIERETRHDEDRALVSSVIHNRLDIDMALQVDATIQYAKGKTGDSWWTRITQREYRSVDSPYNTYLYPGLPPGPIANPGFKSLDAAANPADTNYIFYITDRGGVNRYARTLDEHNANIRQYGL